MPTTNLVKKLFNYRFSNKNKNFCSILSIMKFWIKNILATFLLLKIKITKFDKKIATLQGLSNCNKLHVNTYCVQFSMRMRKKATLTISQSHNYFSLRILCLLMYLTISTCCIINKYEYGPSNRNRQVSLSWSA